MLLRIALLGFFVEFGYVDAWKLQFNQSLKLYDQEYSVYIRLYPIWFSFGWSRHCLPCKIKIDPPLSMWF